MSALLPSGGQESSSGPELLPPGCGYAPQIRLADFFADSRVVIALVQTEMAYGRAQKPAAHFPGVLQRRFYQAAVMNIGTCDCHSQRNTLTIHMEMYLAAASAPVRRVASKALSR